MNGVPSDQPLVVVGASAGGVAAMIDLAGALPADFAAPIVVVVHIGSYDGRLPDLVARRGRLPARYARDGEVPQRGCIYFAPPDHHVAIDGGALRLLHGAKENYARPAIDPLFRSAALRWPGPVVGVVLTGMLDDGAAGLRLVKEAGGTAIVQDPNDAHSPSMPRAALAATTVDYCVPLAAIAPLLTRLVGGPMAKDRTHTAPAAGEEVDLTLGRGDPFDVLSRIGRVSRFSCPECGGNLWQLGESPPQRFRCHTGHSYTVRTLEYAKEERSNEALWVALRTVNEKQALLQRMADDFERTGQPAAAAAARDVAGTAEAASSQLRALLERLPPSIAATTPDDPSP